MSGSYLGLVNSGSVAMIYQHFKCVGVEMPRAILVSTVVK